MSVTHSMFTPVEQRTSQRGLALADPPKEPEKLDEKYRPRTFAEMVGQSYAVMALQDYAANPFPQAFLFSGETGTGKTTAALALAHELGVNMDWNFLKIESGEMNDDAVTTAYKMMRQCGVADGWKLILCDEGDLATNKAKGMWLSILEDIPRKSVVVFTTNDVEKFGQRFIDRCEHITFESNGRVLRPDGQAYLNRLWIAERLAGNPPNIEDCKGVILQNVISFRRIARFVESEMRKQASQPKPQAKPVITTSQHNAIKQGVRL